MGFKVQGFGWCWQNASWADVTTIKKGQRIYIYIYICNTVYLYVICVYIYMYIFALLPNIANLVFVPPF